MRSHSLKMKGLQCSKSSAGHPLHSSPPGLPVPLFLATDSPCVHFLHSLLAPCPSFLDFPFPLSPPVLDLPFNLLSFFASTFTLFTLLLIPLPHLFSLVLLSFPSHHSFSTPHTHPLLPLSAFLHLPEPSSPNPSLPAPSALVPLMASPS